MPALITFFCTSVIEKCHYTLDHYIKQWQERQGTQIKCTPEVVGHKRKISFCHYQKLKEKKEIGLSAETPVKQKKSYRKKQEQSQGGCSEHKLMKSFWTIEVGLRPVPDFL